MKQNNLIISTLIILFTLSSCDKNDSSSNEKEDLIIGKWKLSIETLGGQNRNISDCRKEETMEFFENGTAENYFEDNGVCNYSTITVDYEVNGTDLIFTVEGEGQSNGTYKLTTNIDQISRSSIKYTTISDNEKGAISESERVTQTYQRAE